MGVFRCLLFFLLVHHRHGATGDGDQLTQYSESGSANHVSELSFLGSAEQTKSKFPLRKCCPPGKVYHQFNHVMQDTNEKCRDHSNVYQQSSILIEISQELFFTTPENVYNGSASYSEIDFDIKSGFPENCDEMMLLEPDAMPADRFYPLVNGDLVVPHRFWVFPPESHCMEDFFADDDFNKVRRVAIICADKARTFPREAIDENNRLQLKFLDHRNTTSSLNPLSGRQVIRKCCDFNEVYSALNNTCIPKQGYGTQYFDDLLSEGDDLFLRAGLLNCSDQQQPEFFEWTTNWMIRIQMNADEDWDSHSYTSDEYCVDDFVVFLDDELPETINLVTVCPVKAEVNRNTSGILETRANDTNLVLSNETATLYAQDVKVNQVPKCCPRGFIIDGNTCKQLELKDQVPKLESILLRSVMEFSLNPGNATLALAHHHGAYFPCSYDQSQILNSAPSANASSHTAFPKFRASGQLETTFYLNLYGEQNWDYDIKIPHYCVEMKYIHNQEGNNYEPHAFFCFAPSHISGHYPTLFYISSIALVFTFLMYILTPVEGVDKIAASDNGQVSSLKVPRSTLGGLLTGRNLLCHISSLCLAFACLAITQQRLVRPGQPGCIATGYITYGATIASCTWFTVYCFHYFCIIQESLLIRKDILFLPYSLFGWGIPIVALVIAAVAQFHPKSNLPQSINPNMGLLRCWFGNETSSLVFFYVPICFLLSLNILFFMALLVNLALTRCRRRNTTDSRQPRSNRAKASSVTILNRDIKAAVSMFFITEIPWVFEIASWIPSYFCSVPNNQQESLRYLLEAGNVLNALRGIFIFVLFLWAQPDVRAQIFFYILKLIANFTAVPKTDSHTSTSASSQRNDTNQLSNASSDNSSSRRSSSQSDHLATSLKAQTLSFEPNEVTVL